jgi:cysteine-rich repeat protein
MQVARSPFSLAPPLAALVLALAGCGTPSVPEGRYSCTPGDSSTCPAGWLCPSDGRCWSSAEDGGDADGDADGDTDGDAPDVTDDGPEDDGLDGDGGEADGGCDPTTCVEDGNSCNGERMCSAGGECIVTRPPDEGTECTTLIGVAGRCFLEQCRPDTCGNSVVEEGEDCDDGNFVGDDGCEPDCTFTCQLNAECIDAETCDGDERCLSHVCVPGTLLADGTPCGEGLICVAGACGTETCGNGYVGPGEICDDGNTVDGDGCDVDCTWSCTTNTECDDLALCNGTETCDTVGHLCLPGVPAENGTPCSDASGSPGLCRGQLCAPETCGNGTVDTGEQCDDGNTVAGDGCEGDCTWTCEAAADCDDGDPCNGDETCALASHTCRPGSAPADGTSCDRDGNPGTRDICRGGSCELSTCGDGWADAVAGEECDDGNTVAKDGCENDCTWSCSADPDCDDGDMCSGTETCRTATHLCQPGTALGDGTTCTTAGGVTGVCRSAVCVRSGCGDGTVDPGEECDDGNAVNGDGCETNCLYSCHVAADCREVPDNPCTTDTCSAVGDGQRCTNTPNTDACDDADVCSSPDACDGAGACVGPTIDADGDTYGPGAGCGGDCDDGAAAIHPGATELCNGVDDDCSGQADDGAGMTCALGSSRTCVTTGPGGTCAGTEECGGSCVWTGTCALATTEICNGTDDDCDGSTDEGFDCALGGTVTCTTSCTTPGTRTCGLGCVLGPCIGPEVACNSCDDDGDGTTDEGSWCTISPVPTTVDLFGVRGSAADDAWAVGDAGTILHWNGTAWSSTTSGTRALRGVWAASATAAWAVGDSATIRRWNGTAWTAESAGSVTSDLFDVRGTSDTDVWAVGADGRILHRTGGTWSAVSSGSSRTLHGVWAPMATQVFAGGFHGVIRLWDGAAWGTSTSGVTDDLYAVSGASGNGWTVGEGGTILRWSGTRWSSSSSATSALLRGVYAAPSGLAWAVGDGGVIRAWSGSAWSSATSGVSVRLEGVWGASDAEVWAVGAGGTILRWRE